MFQSLYLIWLSVVAQMFYRVTLDKQLEGLMPCKDQCCHVWFLFIYLRCDLIGAVTLTLHYSPFCVYCNILDWVLLLNKSQACICTSELKQTQ